MVEDRTLAFCIDVQTSGVGDVCFDGAVRVPHQLCAFVVQGTAAIHNDVTVWSMLVHESNAAFVQPMFDGLR